MRLLHGRVELELHERKGGEGVPLLLLHALGGSAAQWPAAFDTWPGPVFALDFSGHGGSAWVRGGAYSPELLVGDADIALAQTGPAAVAGAGVGAYAALLLAGARPTQVPAALLMPGAGLAGGGAAPDPRRPVLDVDRAEDAPAVGCDPALRDLERDVRPPTYAGEIARDARCLILLEDGSPRPPWWQEARKSPGCGPPESEVSEALARLATPQ